MNQFRALASVKEDLQVDPSSEVPKLKERVKGDMT
jgi:hypothetical protein